MEVVASAPGKVLMTGGYLVLERPNAGIVLSTNARFYAIVKPLYEEIKPGSSVIYVSVDMLFYLLQIHADEANSKQLHLVDISLKASCCGGNLS